ncbi:MAG TPA: ATP-binding protein [Acidobacteriota bacterium]|nr:ATP-binding protein [Acidobacteriota bacterium]
MILGRIVGKVNTKQFTFLVESDAKNFEYVQVPHHEYGYVLCQIVELQREGNELRARCQVIGYKDENGAIHGMRDPFDLGAEVLRAEDSFITEVVKLQTSEKGALIGKLEGRDINIYLDLQNLLTKHLAVLAKSGAGKSYCVGVLLEEIMEKHVPLLIIDPHGEYGSLKLKNTNEKDTLRLNAYNLKPKAYLRRVTQYGDPKQNPELKPLFFSEQLEAQELLEMLPAKLSAAQEGLLYGAMKKLERFDFPTLISMIEAEESPAKWNIIKMIEYLRGYGLFASVPTAHNELIQGGKCSVINLRGIAPQVQEIIVYKLLKDLFEARKQNKIPPFFCVVEEAHNFCPERSFGQSAASQVLRTIASEGRKFGMGLAIISQRPARVDKSVLSQVSTQIILKVTNPNDLKAISNSVEGITSESEAEIQNLAIGQALVTGVVDVPLFVSVRPRMTQHGGASVDILENFNEEKKFFEQIDEFSEKQLLPLIHPKMTAQDFTIINGKKPKVVLVPAVLFLCQSQASTFNLLFDRNTGALVKDIDSYQIAKLPELEELSEQELAVLRAAYKLKRFSMDMLLQQGFGFEVSAVVEGLIAKKYLSINNPGEYKIDDVYVLSHLRQYQIFDKIEYKQASFDEKVHASITVDALKTKVGKFVTIKDLRDCFIVRYMV